MIQMADIFLDGFKHFNPSTSWKIPSGLRWVALSFVGHGDLQATRFIGIACVKRFGFWHWTLPNDQFFQHYKYNSMFFIYPFSISVSEFQLQITRTHQQFCGISGSAAQRVSLSWWLWNSRKMKPVEQSLHGNVLHIQPNVIQMYIMSIRHTSTVSNILYIYIL
jgi:hypothetical protein